MDFTVKYLASGLHSFTAVFTDVCLKAKNKKQKKNKKKKKKKNVEFTMW